MMLRPGRVVAVGSVVGRLTLTVPHLPSKGSDVLAEGLRMQAGGGFVVLASAVNLGLPAALAGRVGDGPIAQLLRGALERAGVEVLVDDVVGEQGFSVCVVEPDGDRTFVSRVGVEASLLEDDLRQVRVQPDDAVVVQGFDLVSSGGGEVISRWCAQLGPDVLVTFDPGPLLADIPDPVLDRMLGCTDVLLLGPRELSLLTGRDTDEPVHDAMSLLGSLAPDAVVLLRQREVGSWLVNRTGACRFDPVDGGQTVDASIADDVYTAAFLAELARLGEVELAARHATVAASITTMPADPNRTATGPTRERLNEALASLAAGSCVRWMPPHAGSSAG